MKLRNHCCCAPYPTVDLTEAFPSSSSQTTNLERLKDIQKQVTHACERYGCFHVTLSASKLSQEEEEESSDFRILQDEKVVRKTFESIFRHENNHDHNTDETCCSSCCISSFFSSPVDGSTRAARYRGRSAESGSSFGMEPKQSWEIFRCRNMLPVTRSLSFSSTRTQEEGTKGNDDEDQQDLGILHRYMEVLHKVSVCLLRDVLEMPYFVDSDACQCGNTEQLFCSVDLLRAFQYDAVKSSQVLSNLGSSPHTDWGSLTVVWQDSKGGLQIYCHEHQIWNDVEIGKDDSTSDDNGDDSSEGEGLIRFFIHVGDFTSLVMNHAKDSTANGNRKEEVEELEDRLVWPSPLHRVLCPTLDDEDQEDGSRNIMESTRCSLVYFAYPTKGLSLEDVQNSVSDKIQEQSHHHDDDVVPYERFLVLNDQSKEGGGGDSAIMEEPEQVYQKMKSIPFHQVIQDKWKQVQR